MNYLVIYAGCAECGDSPLIDLGSVYESIEEAKKNHPGYSRWEDHPEGGIHAESSSSGVWIAPMEKLMIGSEEL